MIRLTIAFLILFAGQVSADITVDSTRKSAYDYACVDVSGLMPITNHQRFDKAQSVCVERALNDPAGTYEVQGGRWRVSVDVGQTAPPPTTNPNVVFQVNVACVPVLEGILPNATFDVDQCVTGQGTYTVSADSGWTVNGTTIAAPASGSGSMKLVISFDADDVAFVMTRLWSITP